MNDGSYLLSLTKLTRKMSSEPAKVTKTTAKTKYKQIKTRLQKINTGKKFTLIWKHNPYS